jgi:hypothetical protein
VPLYGEDYGCAVHMPVELAFASLDSIGSARANPRFHSFLGTYFVSDGGPDAWRDASDSQNEK